MLTDPAYAAAEQSRRSAWHEAPPPTRAGKDPCRIETNYALLLWSKGAGPHLTSLCIIRIAMLEASRLTNISVTQISFARALTETRLFLKLVLSTTDVELWPSIRAEFVQCCARHRVHSKPGRQFPRDRQEYRRKSRGLEKFLCH